MWQWVPVAALRGDVCVCVMCVVGCIMCASRTAVCSVLDEGVLQGYVVWLCIWLAWLMCRVVRGVL